MIILMMGHEEISRVAFEDDGLSAVDRLSHARVSREIIS